MGNLIIRNIQVLDNEKLATIIRRVIEEYDVPKYGTVYSDPSTDDLYGLFSKEGSAFFVAEKDETVLGCGGIYPTEGLPPHCAELVKLYLSKDARGKGIGRALMEKCIDAAKANGYKQLYLESLPQFAEAVNMYKQYGFEMITGPLGNSGHTSCNVWMLKQL